MKLSLPTLRTLLLTLLVALLGACEDPWDRVQGEPSGYLSVTDRAPGGPDAAGAAHDVENTEDDH